MEIDKTLGLQITEKEYRDLPFPSYSLFSDMEKHGPEIVNGKKNEDISELDGIMVGSMVDSILTCNKLPDDFHVIKKKPTGKAKQVLKVLAEYLNHLPDPNDLFSEKNEDIINKCCEAIKYHKASKKSTPEILLEKRKKGLLNYKEYFELISTVPKDSFIISEYLNYQANKCVKTLIKEFPHLFNDKIPNEEGLRIIAQTKLLGKVGGIEIKGMMDLIVIDDENKVITPIDLKTGAYSANSFYEEGFIGWNYYLQCGLYKELLIQNLKKHPIYSDYEVDNFVFVYCSRMDFTVGTLEVNSDMNYNSFHGFDFEGVYKKGLYEIIDEYVEHKV